MARYERDYGREYGRDFGRRRQGPPFFGGMRSDGWGGNEDWQNFAGEEGWPGAGYAGMSEGFYDSQYRQGDREGRRGSMGGPFGGRHGGQGPGGDWYGGSYGGGYGGDYGGYSSRGYDAGYRGRDMGHMEGWDDRSSRSRGGIFGQSRERYRAADIMTENPHAVTPDTPLIEVARNMRDLDVGIIPVVDNAETRRLRGVITDRDIAVRAVAEGKDGSGRVSDCMTERVRHVNKNDSVNDVMRVMRQEQVRRVPVTDREGRLVGIIAQADMAVDYANDDTERESQVGEVIERISEPARPRRENTSRMAASGRKGDREQKEE